MIMGYSNSSLVAYTLLSPNHSGLRTEQIDRISPHCVVGQCTAEGLGDWFHKSSTKASSNYGIDKNGRIEIGQGGHGYLLLRPSGLTDITHRGIPCPLLQKDFFQTV